MSHPTNETTEAHRSTDELTASVRHRLLRSERRRQVLDELAGRTAAVELRDLAREVAERDDEDAVQRVAVSLHHTHLPLMDDLDVLSYDAELNRVDPTGGGTHTSLSGLAERL